MDIGTLIVELVKAAAWPVTSIVLALMFRRPVISLIQGVKLKKIKRGEWEADFQETLGEVRREVAALGPEAVAPSLPVAAQRNADADQGAVARAWEQVEATIDAAARQSGVNASTLPEKLRGLGEKGVLQPATVDAVNGLRVLRNLSVHAPEPVPAEKIREFVEMANAVVFAVTMNIKQAAKKRTE